MTGADRLLKDADAYRKQFTIDGRRELKADEVLALADMEEAQGHTSKYDLITRVATICYAAGYIRGHRAGKRATKTQKISGKQA